MNSYINKKKEKDKSENLFSFIFKLFNTNRNRPLAGSNIQTELDKKLVYSLSRSKIPSFRQLKYISRFLNQKERLALKAGLFIFFFGLIFSAVHYYYAHLEIAPAIGDKYIEGIVGSPKYLNPLYASANGADNDISSLVYSSLYKRGQGNKLVPDLAESLDKSADGLAYAIKIKAGAKWHNGSALTVDDIIFTFNAIKNSSYHSPLRLSFSGVEIEQVDNQTVKFILTQPYAPFLELLTFGILPEEQWAQIPPASANLAAINLKPIGSGPFSFKSLVKDQFGNIRSITLSRFGSYFGESAYLDEIIFKFFANIEEAKAALNKNDIMGISYLFKGDQKGLLSADALNFYELDMPQLTAIFFNKKNNPALDDKNIRIALALAIDRPEIINSLFNSKYKIVDGPVLPSSFAYNPNIKKYGYDKSGAEKLLEAAGWKIKNITKEMVAEAEKNIESKNEAEKESAEKIIEAGEGNWRIKENTNTQDFLSINFVTIDNSDNFLVAEMIKGYWEAVGIKTIINIRPPAQIQAETIKPRDFDALFYGQVLGADPDVYAFWHSSQAGGSGLNIADFSNKEADQLLEDGRKLSDEKIRQEKYFRFQEIIAEEVPAIFMYSPTYTYVQSKKIKGYKAVEIISPRDRFSGISGWYIKTKSKIIWKY